MPDKRVEIRSEEVQDILGQIPHWIIRWGITVIFIALLILIAGSYFFKYPDIVHSTVMVTTENPPAAIIARSNGKLDKIWVEDEAAVTEGQKLALIQNPANYRHYKLLVAKLDSLSEQVKSEQNNSWAFFDPDLELGEMQQSYAVLISKYDDLMHFYKMDYYGQKIQALRNRISKYDQYYERLKRQKNVIEKEVEIYRQQFKRDQKLFEKDVLSKSEYEQSESKLLEKEFEFEKANTSLANTRMELEEIQQEILELRLETKNKLNSLELDLKEAVNKLRSSIKAWEYNYLLVSPLEGKVSFTKYWSENQNVVAGDRVFTVVPRDAEKLTGRITLQIKGSGKVKQGQAVHIKFDNYPHMEYGMVSGVVKSISMVPEDNHFIVEVDLPNGLETNYGKELIFAHEMQGKAEIITEEVRLIEKFFNPIRSIIEKQKM